MKIMKEKKNFNKMTENKSFAMLNQPDFKV